MVSHHCHKSYRKSLYPKVKAFLEQYVQQQNENAVLSEEDLADIEGRMTKWIALVPCYSLESWLYRNFTAVFEIFDKHYPRHTDRQRFTDWQSCPETLDEILQIKEQTVLRDQFNGMLATESFPVERVYQASPSFRDSVERAKACTLLVRALECISF